MVGIDIEQAIEGTGIEIEKPVEVLNMNEKLQRAKKKPKRKQILGTYIMERSLTLIQSKPKVGKSSLAVQICIAVAKGESLFGLTNNTNAMKVLYIDLENGEEVLRDRYENLIDENLSNLYYLTYEDFGERDFSVSTFYEEMIEQHNAKFVVVDNLGLTTNNSLQDPINAKNLIKMFKDLKSKYNLTLILVGHINKGFQNGKQRTSQEQTQGSSVINERIENLISLVAFDEDDSKKVYLKQEFNRHYETNDKVLILNKSYDNYLKFDFVATDYESNLIKSYSVGRDVPKHTDKLEEIFLGNKALFHSEILTKLIDKGINSETARKIIKRHHNENKTLIKIDDCYYWREYYEAETKKGEQDGTLNSPI